MFKVVHDKGQSVLRDEEQLFVGTETQCYEFIHKHQGQSIDYALRHGGYKIVPVPKDVPVMEVFEGTTLVFAHNHVTKHIAIQVLNFLNEINQQETGTAKEISSGGSFKVALFEVMCRADSDNFAKLELGFRGEAQALYIYKNVDNGVDVLKEIAGL